MSFGAIIAVKKGPIFVPVDFGLECALTEVRVEQSPNKQTTFALRFQEDYENDKPTVTEHEIFKSQADLAILVPDGPDSKDLICLVRGQIEQLSFDVALGGPGSSFEARGRDVRTILGRVCAPESLTALNSHLLIPGLITDIPEAIPLVEPGEIIYDGQNGNPTINHLGTKLELIEYLAANENQQVWLSYSVTSAWVGVSIITKFNVKASPARGASAPPAMTPLADKRALRVLTDSKECPNVANFKVSSDNERIKVVHAAAIDESNGGTAAVAATTADDNANDGVGIAENGGHIERSSCSTGAGSPPLRAKKAEKEATDQSWFVTAEALTSASMYQGVLEPHQQVTVMGVGCEWAGEFQVQEVTHVINSAEHWMNVKLRSNSRNEKKL